MRRVFASLVLIVALGGGAFLYGPYEPVDLRAQFDASALGGDVASYLAQREAVFDDIEPGAEKRVLWAGEAGKKTKLSLVYVHGFSATSAEIQPVPEKIAKALGANLYLARLAGHGRSGAALAGPRVNDWMIDMAEAMAVGREIGEEVVVIGNSTGATLAALMALDAEMSRDLKGLALLSPNFKIKSKLARLLTWPGARSWLPALAGETRSFEVQNTAHAAHWTESYPTAALFPMAAMVEASRAVDFSKVKTPALFYFSPQDQVVDGRATQGVATEWGGASKVVRVAPGEGLDPNTHVLAGDILSPGGTEPMVAAVLRWIRGL